MYLGPLLTIWRIGRRKNCPAILKCWQNRSFWKREGKYRKRTELKAVLFKQGHSLALFLQRSKKITPKPKRTVAVKTTLSCFEMM